MTLRKGNRFWGRKGGGGGVDLDAFMMTFALGASDSITLPLISAGTYDFVVDWGDGNTDVITVWNQAERTHSYSGLPAGDYVVTITGTCTHWSFNSVTTSRTKLKSVDQWGDTGFTTLPFAFLGCSNLVSVAGGLTMSGVSLAQAFRQTKLASLPSDLFSGCGSVQDFSGIFLITTTITAIPAGLFDPCVSATNFFAAFQSLPITTIPADLFRYNTQVINFGSLFLNCTAFTSIPADTFRYNTSVTNFSGAFNNTRITTVPTDIFRYNTLVTDFSNSFRNNPSLSNLPTDIFRYNTSVTTFYAAFLSCTGLSSLPTDIFRYNTLVTTFGETFRSAGLTSFPSALFNYNTSVTTYLLTFFGCASLSGNVSILASGMTMTAVTTTNQMFLGCTSLTGNGQDLIDKPKAGGYTVGTSSGTGSYRTFFNCTALTDFASISANYK